MTMMMMMVVMVMVMELEQLWPRWSINHVKVILRICMRCRKR